MKEVIKWGLIAVVALLGWRVLSGAVSGFLSGSVGSSAAAQPNPGFPVYAGNYQNLGVWGTYPPGYSYNNPFYSSPEGGGGRGRRPRRG